MDIDSAFPGKYLKASDLKDRDARVVIGQVVMEVMNDGKSKPVIFFRNKGKGLVLNISNKNTIKEMFGAQTEQWIDKQITLYPTKVEMRGEMVDAIRIRYVEPPKPKNVEPAQSLADEMSDEIPW